MDSGTTHKRPPDFSTYFMATLAAALLFPGFTLFTEWIIPPFFIYPITAARMGNIVLFYIVVIAITKVILVAPILAIIYWLDVFVSRRLFRRLTGGRLVFFPFLWSLLKLFVRFAIFTYFYGAILLSLYFGLVDHAAALLFSASVVILVISFVKKWHDVLFLPGWKHIIKIWPFLSAACLISGLAVIFEPPRSMTLVSIGATCLIASVVIAILRIKESGRSSQTSVLINLNAVALLSFFISLAVIGNQFLLTSHKERAMSDTLPIVRAETVYGVLPDDENGAIFFTTLNNYKAVGKKQTDRKVIWTTYNSLNHMERILNLRAMNAIAVFGRSGFYVFSKDNLDMIRNISKSNFVDAEVSPDGNLIYAVREYDNYFYMISPKYGLLRTYRMGSRLLCPYAIRRTSPTTFFVDSWFTSPLLLKIDLTQHGVAIRKKALGFFNTGMAADTKRNRLYVSRSLFNRIDVLDMDTLKVIGNIPLKIHPREILFDGKRGLLIAPGFFSGEITVIDTLGGFLYMLPPISGTVRSVNLSADGDTLYFGTSKGVFALDWGRQWKHLLDGAERDGRKYCIKKKSSG